MVIATKQNELLQDLDLSVKQIVDFLVQVDEDFYDGFLTAREILSHLIFWHREYVAITDALGNKRIPHLRQSTFIALNARATREFRSKSMQTLCQDFLNLQIALVVNLQRLPDWDVEFPVKKGCRRVNVTERLQLIQEHVDGHYARLESAQRHGEAWVRAYYPKKKHMHN